MIYIALLAVVAGWLVSTTTLLAALRSQSRAHARREDLILNQLLHAVGKPWIQAPADERDAPQPEPPAWTASPEQLPLDE